MTLERNQQAMVSNSISSKRSLDLDLCQATQFVQGLTFFSLLLSFILGDSGEEPAGDGDSGEEPAGDGDSGAPSDGDSK